MKWLVKLTKFKTCLACNQAQTRCTIIRLRIYEECIPLAQLK